MSEPPARSRLLAAAFSSAEAPERDDDDATAAATESTPLLPASASDPRYDGEGDHDDPDEAAGEPSEPLAPSKTPSGIRWPSVIAMVVLAGLSLGIMVFAFMVPSAVEEYAKQAVVIEPTNLSLESITANGIRARIQANYRLDSQRVPNEHVRRIGRAATWLVGSVSTAGETRIRVYLPAYDNLLLGTAGLPPLRVSLLDGPNKAIDFVAELVPGDAEGMRRIANEWLEGRLGTVRLRGQADVQLKAGILPLGTHSIAESLTFQGGQLPRLPEYNITRIGLAEQPVPGGSPAVAVDVSIAAHNEHPLSLEVPALAFDVLIPGCGPAEPPIVVAGATTSPVAVRPAADVMVSAHGLVRDLPEPLLRLCPGSDSSPLDMLLRKYLGGEAATVLVRGQERPAGDAPAWLSKMLASIAVPVPLPGRSLDNLIRSFSLADVSFAMPDPLADPDDPASNPRVSGTILVLAGLPADMNVSLNVTAIRADADVFYRGDKLGELTLKRWHPASSTQVPATDDGEATLKIRSTIRDAPLNVTDADVLADVIQALLFGGREVMLAVKALVDVQVETVLGELVVKAVPAEGQIPVKPLGADLLGSVAPRVEQVEIIDTTSSTLTLRASVTVANPTPYAADVPYVSVHVESNGTTIGEAVAYGVRAHAHADVTVSVRATWNPSLGGDEGVLRGRDLLSEYISGHNTTVTLRSHGGSIPALPALGKALSRLALTLPAPRLRLPGDGGGGHDDGDADDGPRFIRDATFHVLSSTATFVLASPLLRNTLFIDWVNATALYNHTEPIGTIRYGVPFAVRPGLSTTPRLPVDWSLDSIGYRKLREALGGRLKLDAKATVGVRVGRWRERVRYEGQGIGAGVSL
ncbi:hypothetical protein VTJ83DRAFT_6718 [Remersonia thermophila]|uniref:Uncharacterized protein n=1 Tax=Remersonia thermophila TaxID=72144 RepID=A0ABR4D5K5_9PEZI